jgi:hypothetical protein
MVISLLALAAISQTPDLSELVDEATKRVQESSNNATLRFELGRLRMHQWAQRDPDGVQIVDGRPKFPAGQTFMMKRNDVVDEPGAAALLDAVRSFNRAARIDSANGQYGLANAWAFEQLGRNYKAVLGDKGFGDFKNEFEVWGKVAAEYRRTYAMSRPRDLKRRTMKAAVPEDLPGKAAAERLIALGDEKKARVTAAERKRLSDFVKQFR